MKPHPKGQPGGPGLKKRGGGYRSYPNNKPTFSQISNLFASFDQNYLVQETAVKRNPILLLRVTQMVISRCCLERGVTMGVREQETNAR